MDEHGSGGAEAEVGAGALRVAGAGAGQFDTPLLRRRGRAPNSGCTPAVAREPDTLAGVMGCQRSALYVVCAVRSDADFRWATGRRRPGEEEVEEDEDEDDDDEDYGK